MSLTYKIESAAGGSFAKLSVSGGGQPGGRRGDIKGFSPASKKRMLDEYHKIPKPYRQKAIFITLTYPGKFSLSWQDWKRDLDVFLKRFMRRYPKATVLWKIELQERGAPHYHLIVWGVPFIPHGWVATAWFETVGSGDLKHLAAGTETKAIKGDKQAVYYVCKYIAKIGYGAGIIALGRVWGFRGKRNLPVYVSCRSVDALVFYEVRRVLRAWIARQLKRKIRWGTHGAQGITAYIDECTLIKLIGCAQDKFA